MFHSHEVESLAWRRQADTMQAAERERELRAMGVERPLLGLPSLSALARHLVRARRAADRGAPLPAEPAPRLRAARP